MKTFYKWFNKQSVLIKAILLLIPGVDWIVEILIRGSKAFHKKDVTSIVVFLLFLFVGWSWVIEVIDFIYMLLTGHLILAGNK